MPAQVSESIILRTFPFGEADLIVSYFTRDHGKLRGAAKRARRPKSPFGAALERMCHAQVGYYLRENRELSSLDSCEIIRSSFTLLSTYEFGVGLDYITEVSEELLPPHEPNEKYFRLLLAILDFLHASAKQPAAVWPAVLYFQLWAVRLSGFLPGLPVCEQSLEIAREMFAKPIQQLEPREWSKETAADLRQFLHRAIHEQVERRLMTVPQLEAL